VGGWLGGGEGGRVRAAPYKRQWKKERRDWEEPYKVTLSKERTVRYITKDKTRSAGG